MSALADTFAFAHLCIWHIFIQHNIYCIQGVQLFSVLAFSENHEYASAKHYPDNNNNNHHYPLLLLLFINNNIIFIIFNVDNYENAVK